MKYTRFYDKASGGTQKFNFKSLIINLPIRDAVEWFEKNYQDPYNVTCECCGSDFIVDELSNILEGHDVYIDVNTIEKYKGKLENE